MTEPPLPTAWDHETDLLVVGSGGGAMAAAIRGHDLGLKTLMIEKSEYWGGTTAISGGGLWIVGTPDALAAGDSTEKGYAYLKSVIETTEMRVREGSTLSRALGTQAVFSPLFVHMLRSGEATGQLAEMLKFGAENAEFDAEQTTRLFTSVLEPVMILFMGIMVLGIVMAVMQPILEMNAGIR